MAAARELIRKGDRLAARGVDPDKAVIDLILAAEAFLPDVDASPN